MTVKLIDKRRPNARIGCIELANSTWFEILMIKGMGDLINIQKTNDPLNVTPARARKMADLIDDWNHPAGWGGENPNWIRCSIVDFLRQCNGFRTI